MLNLGIEWVYTGITMPGRMLGQSSGRSAVAKPCPVNTYIFSNFITLLIRHGSIWQLASLTFNPVVVTFNMNTFMFSFVPVCQSFSNFSTLLIGVPLSFQMETSNVFAVAVSQGWSKFSTITMFSLMKHRQPQFIQCSLCVNLNWI